MILEPNNQRKATARRVEESPSKAQGPFSAVKRYLFQWFHFSTNYCCTTTPAASFWQVVDSSERSRATDAL